MRKPFVVLLLTGVTLGLTGNAWGQEMREIEIIFDASRSMNDASGTATKLEVAKQALMTVAQRIEAGSKVGLRVFGNTPPTGQVQPCMDSALVIPISPFQKEATVARVLTLAAYGATPIGHSLELAAGDFTASQGIKKTVILISDGEESCGKDPVGVIESLKAQGINVVVHAIGFDVDDQARAQLKRLAETAGGTYVDAQNAGELETRLASMAEQAGLLLQPARAAGANLLAASEGARIVTASTEEFAKLIDGQEQETQAFFGGETAVFSFQDGQAIRLERFAVPIFKESQYNPGTIELFGSLEGPDRGFFPIAVIRPENKVFYQNLYQEFPLDPPPAIRYLKAVVGRGVAGSQSYHSEWRAYGSALSREELTDALKEAAAKDRNLLAAENGGNLVATSDPTFKYLIDGVGSGVGYFAELKANSEAVFGFEGGRSVLIKKVRIPIVETNEANVKTIEFSLPEGAATTTFKKLGTFETTNLVFADPYQEFVFNPPVRTKHLRVMVLNSHGGVDWRIRFAELQAIGHFEE